MFIKSNGKLINIKTATDIWLNSRLDMESEKEIYRISFYFDEGNRSHVEFKNLDVAKKAFEDISGYISRMQSNDLIELESC